MIHAKMMVFSTKCGRKLGSKNERQRKTNGGRNCTYFNCAVGLIYSFYTEQMHMNNREEFENQYIAKHFANSELSYRECKKWMADEWLGHKYNDVEIQEAWVKWNSRIC